MRSSLLALALVAGLCASARAQVEPKIYILFDTSGSMLANTADQSQPGDGSPLCTGLGASSRIYQLKVALFDALQGMGASEVDFALATFPMFMEPSRTPRCAIGTLASCSTDAECSAVRPGETCEWITMQPPWPPPTCADDSPCAGYSCDTGAGTCNYTCHPVQRPCAAGWSCANSGECVRQACWSACGNDPTCSGHYFTGPSLISEFGPSPANPTPYGCKVSTHSPLTAAQQSANCGDPSNPCAPWYAQYKSEVLKVGFGSPPEDVMYYFDQQEDHPLSTNPEVRVGNGWLTPLGKSLFYAHGYFHKEIALPAGDYRKKCERLVIAFFTDGNETCNTDPSDPYYPTKWATNLSTNSLLQVKTHTVAIDVTSPLLQQIATAGGGTYVPVSGTTASLKKAFLDIIAQSLPPAETCNGEDDDCDNEVDEDFPLKGTPCNNGKLGVCYGTGSYVCTADGSGVVCDATGQAPGTEICNQLDDDCDGEIDEGIICEPCAPQPEICNGKDDDCDGEIDEEIPSVPCGKEVGECKPGMTKCENGKMLCEGGSIGTDEICDGLDNDCDGQRDGITDVCYPFETGCDVGTLTCQGICKLGWMECTAVENAGVWSGEWGACQGAVGPEPEICDGLDNDCDGEPDNGAECPGGSQCINGACTAPCSGGEFVCPVGQFCEDGWCVPDPCDRAACEAQGHICKAGRCIDPCEGVQCSKFQKCVLGSCVDDSCYQAHPCPEGEVCVQGVCEKDPCAGVTCDPGTYCQGGTCVALCDEIACPAGQVCKLVDEGGTKVTKCVADPCAGVFCASGQACVDGKCVIDPCEALACPAGEVCIDGECQADPCESVACPQNYRCEKGLCVTRAESITRVLATGAGGCACTMTDGIPDGSLLLGLGLLLALAAARRRRTGC